MWRRHTENHPESLQAKPRTEQGKQSERGVRGTRSGDDAKPRMEQGTRSREEQVQGGTATAMAWLARERKGTTRRDSAAQRCEGAKKEAAPVGVEARHGGGQKKAK